MVSVVRITILIAAVASACFVQAAPPAGCTEFTVVKKDTLGNVDQGLNADDQKWIADKFTKKFPGICYAEPRTDVRIVFFVAVTPATYHGSRVVTSTSESPVRGTVTDQDGNVSQVQGTTTTSSSTAVPYSVDYGLFTLSIERRGDDGKYMVLRRFQQKGLYRTMYGIPLGGRGHHPFRAVMEDALNWITKGGGLNDALHQGTLPVQ
jgi:hypothetical protein